MLPPTAFPIASSIAATAKTRQPIQRRHWLAGALACMLLASTAVLPRAAHAADKPLPVVASFSILADVARHIGGERVHVESIAGADTDMHVYRLKPADVLKIRAARLVLLNGAGFEPISIVRAVKDSRVTSAEAAHGVADAPAGEHDHDHDEKDHHHDAHDGHDHDGHDHHGHTHGPIDPHVWHDPVRMQTYAHNVAKALIQADPAGKAHYQQRLAAYQNQLQTLHQWATEQFATIPASQRKVMTGHDAFGYMAQRYHITFVAPLGVSTESDASAKTVAGLIAHIKRDRIKAVFVENIRDPRLVQQISKEVGITVQTAPLYTDALSATGGNADTYEKLMRYNVQQLVNAMR